MTQKLIATTMQTIVSMCEYKERIFLATTHGVYVFNNETQEFDPLKFSSEPLYVEVEEKRT